MPTLREIRSVTKERSIAVKGGLILPGVASELPEPTDGKKRGSKSQRLRLHLLWSIYASFSPTTPSTKIIIPLLESKEATVTKVLKISPTK